MLETLAFGDVEIERAAASFTADGKSYSAGTYVVSMRQPFSGWAKTLLEVQQYPDLRLYPGGPPKRPYDVTAQTLPMLMGVETDTVKDSFQARLDPATQFAFDLDRAKPSGAWPASDIASWKEVAKAWKAGRPVFRDTATGDFYTSADPGRKELPAPRIGLYQAYVPSMDEGWTRWLLDDFGIGHTKLVNGDIAAGYLRERLDAIVIPDQSRQTIERGYREGQMPPDFTGGLGEKGAAALKEFVEQGGTLILLNHAADYARDLGVTAKNVLEGVESKDFYSPGSLLNASLDPKSPLAYGMPAEFTLWSEGSPAWDAPDSDVVARYPAKGVLASGWLLGEKYIAGKGALLEVRMGRGHILLFGMRPQYRGQSYQDFKLFFNALVR